MNEIYDYWIIKETVHMVFYNVIPFLVMITFNILLVVNIKSSKIKPKLSTIKTASKKNNLTILLLLQSFLFLVMTMPGTILFAYFYNSVFANLGTQYVYMIDDISFLNNTTLFFVCFVSNKRFRDAIIQLGRCKYRIQNL